MKVPSSANGQARCCGWQGAGQAPCRNKVCCSAAHSPGSAAHAGPKEQLPACEQGRPF